MAFPVELNFDNGISMLYKWAGYFAVPTKYVYIREREEDDPEMSTSTVAVLARTVFISIKQILQDSFEDNEGNYRLMAKDLREAFPSATIEDTVHLILFFRELTGKNAVNIANQIYMYITDTDVDYVMDVKNLEEKTRLWQRRYQIELDHDEATREKISRAQEDLLNLEKMSISRIEFDEVKVRFHPRLNGVPVTVADGIDIFNQTILSNDVPFLQYNGDGFEDTARQQYYKIYQGDTSISQDLLIGNNIRENQKNKLYMSILTSEPGRKINTDSYKVCAYDFNLNSLVIRTPITPTQNESIIINKVKKALPTLDFDRSTEVEVKGRFNIYGLEFDDYSLYYILTQPLFGTYLTVDERVEPYPNKSRISLIFRTLLEDTDEDEASPNYFRISLKQFYSEEKLKYRQTDDGITDFEITLEPRTPYVQVRISKGDSREGVRRFIEIFSRLMTKYQEERTQITDVFQLFIPSIATVDNINPAKIGRNQQDTYQGFVIPPPGGSPTQCRTSPGSPKSCNLNNKLDYLQAIAPKIFVNGYAKQCQGSNQPGIINPLDQEDWENDYIEVDDDKFIPRQVMDFPRDNPEDPEEFRFPRYKIVCTRNPDGSESTHPYPGIQINKKLSNRHEFPFVPCCFKVDQRNKPNSPYNLYYHGVNKTVTKASTGVHQLKVKRTIATDVQGFIPKTIEELLLRYDPDARHFIRWGTPTSKSSLLHSVLSSMNKRDYLRLTTDADKEAYVVELRKKIAHSVHPSLLRQELYDFTDDEIIRQLEDPEIFYDPRLYYRALEEYFGINIYVFTPGTNKDNANEGGLEIPRHKLFHARPNRTTMVKQGKVVNRKTVIIFKHFGVDSEKATYPQCEIIGDFDRLAGRDIRIFEGYMNNLLHSTLIKVLITLTWSFSGDPGEEELVVRYNVNSNFDYFKLIGRSAVGQILDDYGKVRGFIFPSKYGEVTMMVPATQPENLPVLNEEPRITVEDCSALFNDGSEDPPMPNSVTVDARRRINGFWYSIGDIPNGIYIPVLPEDGYEADEDTAIGPTNPIFTQGANVVGRIQQMTRTLEFFWQCVRWLFILAQVKAPVKAGVRTPVLPREFAEKYLVVDERGLVDGDSATAYDFTPLPRNLPEVDTLGEAFKYLRQWVPTFVIIVDKRWKIRCYSEGFLDKLSKKLEQYYELYSPLPSSSMPYGLLEDWVVPKEIENYYQDAGEFSQQDSVAIFIGRKDIESWMDSIRRPSNTSIIIRNKLEVENMRLTEPFIYVDSENKLQSGEPAIYLIQNVRRAEMARAVAVAVKWNQTQINYGPQTEPYYEEYPPHVIYGISAAGQLQLVEDNSEGDLNYISLLLYGGGVEYVPKKNILAPVFDEKKLTESRMRYAAMLPIYY